MSFLDPRYQVPAGSAPHVPGMLNVESESLDHPCNICAGVESVHEALARDHVFLCLPHFSWFDRLMTRQGRRPITYAEAQALSTAAHAFEREDASEGGAS